MAWSFACAVCLAAGLSAAGAVTALAVGVTLFFVWLIAWRFSPTGAASAALILSVGVAAAGLSAQTRPLMMVGAVLALTSWDIVHLDEIVRGSSPSPQLDRLLRKHYASLALALTIGLGITLAGSLVRLQVPFVGVVVLSLLSLLGLDRLLRILSRVR